MNVVVVGKRYRSDGRLRARSGGIRHSLGQMVKVISRVVSIVEDAIFKSKDWPYLWDKRR